ncbi:MAG: MFS transporter [Lentisphaerae bacterium]|nr:MFS transporter [Lentisphaerota bacterium]
MNKYLKSLQHIRQDKSIALAVSWSFNQLAYAIVYPFIPIYLCQERGLPYDTVSIIFPLLGLAVILSPLPCGCLADRFGYSKMMFAGQLLRGLIFFILAFFVYIKASFWLFALFLMLNTAVGVAFQVGSDAYLVKLASPELRPGYYSKIRIGFNIGWAIGPMLGAFFAKTPFWAFFILTGMLCLAGTWYTWKTCPNLPDIQQSNHTPGSVAQEKISALIFRNPRFLLLLAGTLLLMLLASQLYSTMSFFATSGVGISREALGSIYSLNGFMVLALQIPLVAMLKKLNIPVIFQLTGGTLLYAIGYFALGFAGNAAAIAFSVVIVTLGEIVVQPALYTSTSRETTSTTAGRMMSFASLMRGIGYSVGPWIGGQLFGKISPVLLWGLLSSFAVGAAAVFTLAGCCRKKNFNPAENSPAE